MNRKILITLVIILLGVGIGLVILKKPFIGKKPRPEKEVKEVFFVHSYGPGHICGQPQDDGAVAKLKELGYREGENLNIHRFYMKTKLTYTTPEEMEMRGNMAIEKIRKVDPDVVFVIDDNAFKYVAMPLARTKYPIVFSGMNAIIEDYDKQKDVMKTRENPGYNITGVLETLHFEDTFRLIQEIVPQAKKVFFTGSETPTAKGFMKALEMEMEQKGTEFPVEVEITIPKTFEEYKEMIRTANLRRDIDVIFPLSLALEGPGAEKIGPKEIITWTLKNSKKPDVGATFFLVGFGYLGGATVDFPALGAQAAVKIAKILRGEDPGNISIDEAKTVSVCVNLARAEQLGIEVPPEVITKADRVYKSMKLYPEYKMKEF